MNYEEFTKSVFKFIIKRDEYSKLKYIRLKIHNDLSNHNPHGVAYKRTIRIFLDQILFDRRSYTEDDMKAYIIFVITHELSHLLQDIDTDRYHSEIQYRNFIEASADIVALDYIKLHYDSIKEKVGYFSLESLEERERIATEYLNKRQ